MDSINWGLIAPLLVIQFILMVTALVSCVRAERTNGPKWMWALIILFISLIGPVLYFTVGRRND
ncbi:PLD nuclease N-terminal domain-containing protein [Paenibacillus contaminans]|uniref:Transcriptional regulator n=1 Tax=Paenibacillus contaminans TaxID=450362 RepID=A0A329MJ53_9BACL|nr:PLD nuclease N-terminal domain-containing protein [Paenibacillus contaminans]RAV17677.1 transcriptional regulator [Paenibacillus contaminans]